ncbi:protein SMAX1-LIKE 3-like [Lolium rigidum]|uniref:protein SMAX1-LIKE 3-like n=1 Tax=Lolium rigidum TaxID=89674 RepID=UPI001F5D39E3|nr:protein SMAX1-LIKE 3-like [Lolium rigidum]
MRAGGCTVQQTLTADAAVMVKQAVSLARRRGNGQVTPLHVASAMLQAPPPSGLLRAACLRSHSHPLQCKALELCFNVALNRLPASAGASPLFGHQHHGQGYYPPSLSNALVAAFKRAQAHQRRGSVETQQQQPVLAVKIELEQLVISILDDPSVSRVMREAGFSSPHVKANVEQAVSSMEGNNPCTIAPAADAHGRNPKPSAAANRLPMPPHQEAKARKLPLDQVREEDVAAILDCLATQSKRRVMVVAESASAAEATARTAVDKIKRGEARQEAIRGAQVVSLKMSMFRDLPRVEAERRLAELQCVVKAAGGAVVVVVEDLMWAAEFWVGRMEAGGRLASGCYYYCGVEHAVAEVRALACHGDGVRLVGYGTYQAYMRCRTGHPSLEGLWGIHTLAVPAGSLALSLNCVDVDSEVALNHRRSMKAECDVSGNGSTLPACLSLLDGGGSGQLTAASTCCADRTATEAGPVKELHRSIVPSSSSIPPWLQHCRDQEPSHFKNCSSTCGGSPSIRTTLNKNDFSTVVSPSSSVSSHEQYYRQQLYQPWLVAEAHGPKHPGRAQYGGDAADGVRLLSAAAKSRDSSASNSSVEVECRSRFKELSAENLKVLCAALEKEVPLQKDIVPEIASTVLRCRSGTAKRRNVDGRGAKEETWMLFLGGDTDGKARVSRELASLVFGSRRSFIFIDVNTLSPARSDSTEQHRAVKRPRSAASRGYLERLFEAVRDNPHRVILMDGVDQVDRRCQMGIKEAVESGVVRNHVGDEVSLGDAIVVLSCESFGSRSKACSPPSTNNADAMRQEDSTSSTGPCFDLNMSVDDVDKFEEQECCFGDAGLLKAVDRTLFFRPPANL